MAASKNHETILHFIRTDASIDECIDLILERSIQKNILVAADGIIITAIETANGAQEIYMGRYLLEKQPPPKKILTGDALVNFITTFQPGFTPVDRKIREYIDGIRLATKEHIAAVLGQIIIDYAVGTYEYPPLFDSKISRQIKIRPFDLRHLRGRSPAYIRSYLTRFYPAERPNALLPSELFGVVGKMGRLYGVFSDKYRAADFITSCAWDDSLCIRIEFDVVIDWSLQRRQQNSVSLAGAENYPPSGPPTLSYTRDLYFVRLPYGFAFCNYSEGDIANYRTIKPYNTFSYDKLMVNGPILDIGIYLN